MNAKITYCLQHNGRVHVIENVPARLCQETGEEYFAPEAVEHIQAIIAGGASPVRVIETLVYDYA